MQTTVVTSATGEPISLREVKEHLRLEVGETAEDDVLNGLISAARDRVESITNRKLMPQTWDYRLDDWPDEDYVEMPYTPLRTIGSTAVTYKNSTAATTKLSSTAWEVDAISEPGRLCLRYNEDWPTATLWNVNPISIRFGCGYSTATAVPETFKLAIKLLVDEWYNNRGAMEETPTAVNALLRPYRVWKF